MQRPLGAAQASIEEERQQRCHLEAHSNVRLFLCARHTRRRSSNEG
jgi:hypothetical protein